MNKIYICLLGCVFLTGCTTQSITTSFYTLNEPTIITIDGVQDSIKNVILIDRISLSDYLRQPGIVVKNANNKISISSKHRWAEGLERGMSRVLRSQLDHKLSDSRVENQNMQWQESVNQRIKIEVSQFELDNTKNQALFSGRFWLLNQQGKLLESRMFVIEKPLETNGFEHAVLKLEAALGDLAEQIANELKLLNQ